MIDATTATFLISCLAQAPERDSVAAVKDWFAARTHPGLVRTENQDRVAVATWHRDHETWWAAVLTDGVGSGRAGAEAATLAVAAFVGSLIDQKGRALPAVLSQAAEDANLTLHRRWRGSEGSTLSAIVARSREVALVNIGDSRAYGVDAAGATRLLTKDDVLPAHGSLLQFIGMGRDLVPHAMLLPDHVTCALLTSDGAHGYLAPILQQVVLTAAHDHRALVNRVVHISNWCGGGDNTSCISLTLRPPQTSLPAVGPWLDLWTPAARNRLALPFSGSTASTRSGRPQQGERYEDYATVPPQATLNPGRPASTSPQHSGGPPPQVASEPRPTALTQPEPAILPGSSSAMGSTEFVGPRVRPAPVPRLVTDAPPSAPPDRRGVTMTYEDVPESLPQLVSEPPASETYRASPKRKRSGRGATRRSDTAASAAAEDGSTVVELAIRTAKNRGDA